MNWVEVGNDRFLEHFEQIRVGWSKFSLDTKTRECSILSNTDWNQFTLKCFLPMYDGLDATDPAAENCSLREYASKYPVPLNPEKEMRILSAYDSSLDLRLIVDGIHRAIALQSQVDDGKNIPPVTVLECYGTQMERIFPLDFAPLLRIRKRYLTTQDL
jgi:hypothetical protein